MSHKRTTAHQRARSVRVLFELGHGVISGLIARFGFSSGGWSHVRPLLDDGSSIDSYEDPLFAPRGGWPKDGNAYPSVIAPGVRHRPAHFREVKASAIVSIPVTEGQKAEWLEFLWAGARAQLPYDHAAIENFELGGNRPTPKNAYICSAWMTKSARVIGLGHKSNIPVNEVSPDALFLLAQEGWGGTVVSP